jgi:acylphosphatase
VTKRVIVSGRVQGVGFRYAVARFARTRSVRGWVRNRTDGTVEALLEGDDEGVAAVIRFCGAGPRGAAVTGIEVTEADATGAVEFLVR